MIDADRVKFYRSINKWVRYLLVTSATGKSDWRLI